MKRVLLFFAVIINFSQVAFADHFKIERRGEKVFVAISENLLGRDILLISRYSKVSPLSPVTAAEETNNQIIKFERGVNNKIFLKAVVQGVEPGDSTQNFFSSVENIRMMPIIEVFEISDYKNGLYEFDVTRFFLSDATIFYNGKSKSALSLGGLATERSYYSDIKQYLNGSEVKVVKTYSSASATAIVSARTTGAVTIEFSYSLILLPEMPMTKREYDTRVGYFNISNEFYDEYLQSVKNRSAIYRWRLEPKDENDAKRQLAGELIEPRDPIVFYIDSATPQRFKPYFKKAVENWQVAFEAAGWKSAIRAEYLTKDSGEGDILRSVIRYTASSVANAYGPTVVDPRTGEILCSHIICNHNIQKILHDWYFVQASPSDTRAREIEYDNELMGELICYVITHEVGHAIGLVHNMGGSYSTLVEKLRDPEWINMHGHTASVMDYTRFNYVAQPGDNVRELMPKVNDYDIWAVKWGYGPRGDSYNELNESEFSNKQIREAIKDPRLVFYSEFSDTDPRCQMEDLGDNSMLASEYGIKNLQFIMSHIIEWTCREGEGFSNLKRLYSEITTQFKQYIEHVCTNIGGVYQDNVTFEMNAPVYREVPSGMQEKAIQFLCENIFKTPDWLIDSTVISNLDNRGGVETIKRLQTDILKKLFSKNRVSNLSSGREYPLESMVNVLNNHIFNSAESDLFTRNLQKIYIKTLCETAKTFKEDTSDISPILSSYLGKLKRSFEKMERRSGSVLMKGHWRSLIKSIETT